MVEQKINVGVSVKKFMYVKKIMFGIPATCICENGKYLASVSAIQRLSVMNL